MRLLYFVLSFVIIIWFPGCQEGKKPLSGNANNIRQLIDTVGFAQYRWQMNSLIDRMDESEWRDDDDYSWRLAICPHDDYTYVGSIYPALLSKVTAPTIIMIGVAHKAAQLNIEDKLVFDTYSHWKGPWGNVRVSRARNELIDILSDEYVIISDTMHGIEHSLEALVPFLQYFNRNMEIIPLLVPAISPERMEGCGKALAKAIRKVASGNGWLWGKDYAIVVTTDAVHYGNEDWGGADRAYFGCDDFGNRKAIQHEYEIMDNCLLGNIDPDKIVKFSTYTLNPDNFREYKWTWCGRYSVPLALYTAYYLNEGEPLTGKLVEYSTSITRLHIPVDDLDMGRTAIATKCHWVGYAAIGYK
jgi:AmmeMemoRadiSam system protein B